MSLQMDAPPRKTLFQVLRRGQQHFVLLHISHTPLIHISSLSTPFNGDSAAKTNKIGRATELLGQLIRSNDELLICIELARQRLSSSNDRR